MQTHLKRWTDSLLEWLGATSAADDGWDRWVAFALVVLAAVLFDLLLRLGIVRGVRNSSRAPGPSGTTRFSAFRFSTACATF